MDTFAHMYVEMTVLILNVESPPCTLSPFVQPLFMAGLFPRSPVVIDSLSTASLLPL